jgi:hypothetical protein
MRKQQRHDRHYLAVLVWRLQVQVQQALSAIAHLPLRHRMPPHRYLMAAPLAKVAHFLVPMPPSWRTLSGKHYGNPISQTTLWRKGTVPARTSPTMASY